jgi:hypothetical protein
MLRPPAGSEKTNQQCRFEKIADVLKGITWGQIAGLNDIPGMDNGGPYPQDSHGNDGGLTEAIAPAHSDNTKNTDCQIGKADLKLEGIPGRPADGLGHRVRDEEVTEKATNSTSGHTNTKEIQQEDFQLAFVASTALV